MWVLQMVNFRGASSEMLPLVSLHKNPGKLCLLPIFFDGKEAQMVGRVLQYSVRNASQMDVGALVNLPTENKQGQNKRFKVVLIS